MNTRTKLLVVNYIAGAMMLLIVFAKPLHIPKSLGWALTIGIFVPLGLAFYYIKRQKQEGLEQTSSSAGAAAAPAATEARQSTKKRLMLLGSAVGLCAPLWLPLTGATMGTRGDLICGIITVAVVCSIVGLRLRKL